MKNLFLSAVLLLLGIFCLVMFMAMPEANATPVTNAELLPIEKGGVTFTTIGPTEAEFGHNVWAFINNEEWKKTSDGTDFFKWNANLYYRYWDNSRYEFYYLVSGNEHSADYPGSPTPILPSVVMLVTGLLGLGWFRRGWR